MFTGVCREDSSLQDLQQRPLIGLSSMIEKVDLSQLLLSKTAATTSTWRLKPARYNNLHALTQSRKGT